MKIENIPFAPIDWSKVPQTRHEGDSGFATWKTIQVGESRVRIVEYSPDYLADHWCSKGHIILVLEGELETELADGRKFIMGPMSGYQVADNGEAHRSATKNGAKLYIVD